nr:hypothetical protein [Paenibacillus phyllosphaerae]
MTADEQVEKLKQYKIDYTLKDIREVWGFKHSAQYYMLLKKLRIYERVVNKSDKFYPEQLLPSRGGYDTGYTYAASGRRAPADQFVYELNVSLSGPELADKLERLAHFLRGEQKNVTIKLSISGDTLTGDETEDELLQEDAL